MLRLLALLSLAGVVLLHGCSSPKGKNGDAYQASRYSQAQDTAPLRHIGPDAVQDAVPRADPILAVGNKSPYTVNGVSYEILEDYRNYRERGTASWYGSKFHGHETSNGEIFDLYAASAAHKTLPIPSYARVTNLANGRSVVVRVNDRGPFHGDRLIDLSYGAAVKLGYMEHGTAEVEVEVLNIAGVDDRRDAPGTHYRFLQLGAFGAESSARRLQGELQAFLQVPVSVSQVDASGTLLYRVRVGPVASADQLALVQQQLRDGGYPAGQPLP
ncbi:septal ring lytic transglycosylase RlpA family protein [Seongchinamella sediminis]|uniref:Endolytic peptidoglycan transglycosylase RlpA n=1 Tax=Seongchinamella sediminis TaxID=2283635 RepID=A0A3L7DUJ9_9GAMM|nr:septal ring lytic transglycosylase RlpA family protein [Seongchinamella sediminis]RLQ21248.1 septal ring lytic transglycosylase RlpA family protein [Seongchinamella sediminis]